MSFPLQGTIYIESWAELSDAATTMKDWLQSRQEYGGETKLLFRGQADSLWQLANTLERRGRIGQMLCADYLASAESIRVAVGGQDLQMPNMTDVRGRLLSAKQQFQLLPTSMLLPILTYWIHLRHHGFPSPLLDWTSSLETAAFFAFSDAGSSSAAAIYAFCERPYGTKGGWIADPKITGISHLLGESERHKRQSAEYTICTVPYGPNELCTFAPHQDPLIRYDEQQDWLVKFELPSRLRPEILGRLADVGRTTEDLLPPVPLDQKISELVSEVFGTLGTAYQARIR